MTPLVAVVGATASGKTALGIAVAERLGGEIVSADSMQVYRGMEIGSAAPTAEERARVPHHLVSFLSPSEHYSAAQFAGDARAIAAELSARGKPTVVVGGAGLYIRALIDGLVDGPTRDDAFREALREEAAALGVPALYARLRAVDPEFAASIHPNDMRRIERGLEVYAVAGAPLSALHRAHRAAQAALPALQVAIDMDRAVLYERIDRRVDWMLDHGFIEEVEALLAAGHGPDLARLRSRGHPELAGYIRGEYDLERARFLIQRNSRRLAKRQLSWFRGDSRIVSLPWTDDGVERLADRVCVLAAERTKHP